VPGPTPTPPPIIVQPQAGSVPVGGSQVIMVSGVLGTITATAQDPKILDVSINQATRALVLSGKAPGSTVVTVTDQRGVTSDIPVRVAYTAGSIAPFATLQLTGDPASVEYIKIQAADLARDLARPREGAQVIVGPEDVKVSAPLEQDNVENVAVPVLIQGEGLFEVDGTTQIRIENVAAPRIAPVSLLVSDYPERLTENGTLFSEDLRSDTPSRFLYFHYNPTGQPDRRIVLRAENSSSEPSTIQFISGAGGPNPNEKLAGHDATRIFLVHLVQNEGRLLTVPAKGSLNVFEQNLPAGSVSSNVLQLRVLDGPNVHLTLFAQDATSDANESLQNTELLESTTRHARGVYTIPEFHDARQWSVNDDYLELSIGQIPLPNTMHGETLAGDYSVLDSFVVNVQNPMRTPQAIAIYENPRGGNATGTYLIDGVLVQSHQVPAFSRYKIRQYVVPAKGFVRVTIVTMAEGGSSYPLKLIFAPDDGSVSPGAPGSPVY
jgi:hypothetical protein